MIGRFIAGKFRNPTGFFGRLVGSAMAKGNEHAANWTVSLLDIQPDSHVLEVGFGPGVAIQYATEKAVKGLVAGIDSSETMVQVATKRNAAAIAAGRVDLKHGEISSLPYQEESFDAVFTIHCIYFWAKPIDGVKEIRRILKPNGLLAIAILPKDTWIEQQKPPVPPPDLFALYNSSEVVQLLVDAGFREVRVEVCPQSDKFPGECILGIK